ncbi:MAG: hypothetical protein AABX25_00480 [Nanoarchaeota archaeon]
MQVTTVQINDLENIASSARNALSTARTLKMPQLGRIALGLFCTLDDALTDIEDGNDPLAVPLDTNNPLHTYKLQLAIAALTAQHLAGVRTIPKRLDVKEDELIVRIKSAPSYNTIRTEMGLIGAAEKYDIVLRVLDYARLTYPKPILATEAPK